MACLSSKPLASVLKVHNLTVYLPAPLTYSNSSPFTRSLSKRILLCGAFVSEQLIDGQSRPHQSCARPSAENSLGKDYGMLGIESALVQRGAAEDAPMENSWTKWANERAESRTIPGAHLIARFGLRRYSNLVSDSTTVYLPQSFSSDILNERRPVVLATRKPKNGHRAFQRRF